MEQLAQATTGGELSIWELFWQAGWIVKLVMIGLIVASVWTWAIIVDKLVAFYAAQTVETTPEMPLPKGVEDATRFGLFTFTIMAKLAENPNVTYRQLGQAVLQQYSADGRTRPTPLFEGELDARVFGTDKTDTVMQWPIVNKTGNLTIAGGLLHRLTAGSKLAILPSALSTMDDAVVQSVSDREIELLERITGQRFRSAPAGDAESRVQRALEAYLG